MVDYPNFNNKLDEITFLVYTKERLQEEIMKINNKIKNIKGENK